MIHMVSGYFDHAPQVGEEVGGITQVDGRNRPTRFKVLAAWPITTEKPVGDRTCYLFKGEELPA